MTRFLAQILDVYHGWLSPWLPGACRFHPTCSVYAAESLRRHGFWQGSLLSLRRLGRCHPFHPGGLDPVPECLPRRAVRPKPA